MQTTIIQRTEVQALLNRARLGMVCRAMAEPASAESHYFDIFKSHAKALADVLEGAGKNWADKDERLGGYHTHGELQAAVTRLPNGFERFTLAEVRDYLAAHGILLCTDTVADSKVDGVINLVNSVGPIVQVDNEHAIAGVDSDDGAVNLHTASLFYAPIVAQGGAA